MGTPEERVARRPEVEIVHPNRQKASSKLVRLIVVLLLLISAAVMVIISFGGWDTLEGAKGLQVAYILIYLVVAFFIARWSRGLLPVASALAIILLIFAAVTTPLWFDRDKEGFSDPALDEGILGTLTGALIPLQILLILFAMRGFAQAWNVEEERPIESRRDRPPGTAATA